MKTLRSHISDLLTANRDYLLKLSLALLCLFTFWNTFGYDFVNYDDPFYITSNEYIQMGLSFEGIKYAFTCMDGFYQPITRLSYLVESSLFNQNASCYHLTNVILHAINVILLFQLLTQINHNTLFSYLTAAIFAVHPQNGEAVCWISERKGLLAMMFALMALCHYLQYIRLQQGAVTVDNTHTLWVSLFFFCSMLSKPSFILFPLILILLYNYVSGCCCYATADIYKRKPLFACIFTCALISVAFTYITAISETNLIVFEKPQTYTYFELWYLINRSLMVLLSHFFVPANLCCYYVFNNTYYLTETLTYLILNVGLFIVIGRFWHTLMHSKLFAGLAIFLFLFAPYFGCLFYSRTIYADRYMYSSMIGLLIVLCEIAYMFKNVKLPIWFIGIAAVCMLMYQSITNNSVWASSSSLWENCLKSNKSALALTNYGATLHNYNNLTNAVLYYKKALIMNAYYWGPYVNMANAYIYLNKPRLAILYLTESNKIRPYESDEHIALGRCYDALKRHSEAEEMFRLAINPKRLETLPVMYYAAHFIKYDQNNLTNIDKALQMCLSIDADERLKSIECLLLISKLYELNNNKYKSNIYLAYYTSLKSKYTYNPSTGVDWLLNKNKI